MSRRINSQSSVPSYPQRNSQGSFSSSSQKRMPQYVNNSGAVPQTSQQQAHQNLYPQNVYQENKAEAVADPDQGQDLADPVEDNTIMPPLNQVRESSVGYDPVVRTISGNPLECGANGIPCKSSKFRRPTTFTNALGRFRNSLVTSIGYPYNNEALDNERRLSGDTMEDFEEEELIDILMTLVFSALCFVLEIYAFIVLVYDIECFFYSR